MTLFVSVCVILMSLYLFQTLRNVIRTDPKMSTVQDSTPHYKLNWIPWRSGIAFVDHGRTLLVIRGTPNEGHPRPTEDGIAPYSQVHMYYTCTYMYVLQRKYVCHFLKYKAIVVDGACMKELKAQIQWIKCL